MVMVMVEMRNQTVVSHLGVHRQGDWVSRRGLVIPPIGILGITIWSIRLWWLILTYSICIF